MTDSTFTDSQEQLEWFHSKTAEFLDEHPEREHSNWRLSERWYVQNKGRLKEKKAKIDEQYDRVATDHGSAQGMLTGEEDKKKHKDPAAQHKLTVQRVNGLIGRLGKAIGNLEGSLPGMKRKLDGPSFKKVKEGLDHCRYCKDHCLDLFEDAKVFDEMRQAELMKELLDIQNQVQEHLDAIKDVLKLAEPSQPYIKGDPTERSLWKQKQEQRKGSWFVCCKLSILEVNNALGIDSILWVLKQCLFLVSLSLYVCLFLFALQV